MSVCTQHTLWTNHRSSLIHTYIALTIHHSPINQTKGLVVQWSKTLAQSLIKVTRSGFPYRTVDCVYLPTGCMSTFRVRETSVRIGSSSRILFAPMISIYPIDKQTSHPKLPSSLPHSPTSHPPQLFKVLYNPVSPSPLVHLALKRG